MKALELYSALMSPYQEGIGDAAPTPEEVVSPDPDWDWYQRHGYDEGLDGDSGGITGGNPSGFAKLHPGLQRQYNGYFPSWSLRQMDDYIQWGSKNGDYQVGGDNKNAHGSSYNQTTKTNVRSISNDGKQRRYRFLSEYNGQPTWFQVTQTKDKDGNWGNPVYEITDQHADGTDEEHKYSPITEDEYINALHETMYPEPTDSDKDYLFQSDNVGGGRLVVFPQQIERKTKDGKTYKTQQTDWESFGTKYKKYNTDQVDGRGGKQRTTKDNSFDTEKHPELNGLSMNAQPEEEVSPEQSELDSNIQTLHDAALRRQAYNA